MSKHNYQINVHNCKQRTEEWYKLKLGKIGGSNAHKLTTKTKFDSYYYELLAETITRIRSEMFINDSMQWGIDNEDFAIEWYSNKTNLDISICGFVELQDTIFGCSPDLLVLAHEGMGQIKCPNSKNHLLYIDKGPDKEIIYQMQWEMYICNTNWNDFITYDPRVKGLEGYIIRIDRDENIIEELAHHGNLMQLKIEEFIFNNIIKG